MQFHSVVTNQIELNQKKNKKDKKVPKQWKRKKLRMSQNIIVMISMMKIVYWSEVRLEKRDDLQSESQFGD
jgi:hypothetical protein